MDELGRQRRRRDAQRARKGAEARRVVERKTRCQRVGLGIVLVQRSTLGVLPSASEFSWLMTSVSVWIRPAIRLFSLRARAIETCCFIVSPEEILHHCVHSSVPFGVAGRLTARIIAYFVRRRKWVKWGNASSIYLRQFVMSMCLVSSPQCGKILAESKVHCMMARKK